MMGRTTHHGGNPPDMDGTPHNQDLQDQNIAEWERTKQRIYLMAILCTIPVFMLSWFFRDPDDTFVAVLYPIFSTFFIFSLPVLWFRLLSISRFEILMLTVVGIIVLSRLGWHFHVPEPIEERLLVLTGGHYWAAGILIIAGYAIFGQRTGFFAGLLVIVSSVFLALTGIAREVIAGEIPPVTEVYVYLSRIHLFLVLILLLTHVVSSLRTRFFSALGKVDELDQRVKTDTLTQLSNRHSLELFLDQQIAASERYLEPFSLIVADIDNFKHINDRYGHPTGDSVLKKIANILAESTRDSDFIARWGGEEFYIVAPHTEKAETCELAERIRKAVSDMELEIGERITISAGVTEFRKGETRAQLERRADNAMYEAKKGGRNRVVMA